MSEAGRTEAEAWLGEIKRALDAEEQQLADRYGCDLENKPPSSSLQSQLVKPPALWLNPSLNLQLKLALLQSEEHK